MSAEAVLISNDFLEVLICKTEICKAMLKLASISGQLVVYSGQSKTERHPINERFFYTAN